MTASPAGGWTRDVPISRDQAALLIIDVQNHVCRRDGGAYTGMSQPAFQAEHGAFFAQFETRTLPNLQRLQAAFRRASAEILYSMIECLTLDGRDRSLDYKISGFNIAKGSWDGKIIDEIAPDENEIVIPKSSSSVFISTNIDYVLRNLQIKQLAVAGLFTDQCVESAIRDACDLGYLVSQVTDACIAPSPERHDAALRSVAGYCRQVETDVLIREIAG